MHQQFRLPDVGEGLTEADILRWDVAVGDTVTVNQTLVEVETAKAAVELPSPFAGVVAALHVDAGQTVDVGTPIITIDTGDSPAAAGAPATRAPGTGGAPGTGAPAREPNLVGYGPGHRGSRRRAGALVPPPPTAPPAAAPAVPSAQAAFDLPADRATVLAKPPVRALARSLGVDLGSVVASGPNGVVTRDDVAAAAVPSPGPHDVPAAAPTSAPSGATGAEQRTPVRGVRKHTAAAMVASAFTAPHATLFTTVDVTATLALRDRIAARPEFHAVRLTPLTFVARAVLLAVARTPVVNGRWEDGADGATIVVPTDVNLGVAAATDRGLVVPNVPAAQTLSLRELAGALAELAATARAGRTAPAALTGGTISVTNVGVFGVDTGAPILNPGEAAILAVGAIRRLPWVVERDGVETIEPRSVVQLAVSIDHRVVDGAQGARFLADVAAVLHDPGLAVL